jgi:glutamate carboxypeptidase
MARVIWQNAPMISRTGLMLALLACPLSAAPARTPLTVAERALVKSVDVHNAECLALLERVVNINSGTHNLSGIREVGRIFRAEFDGLGFPFRHSAPPSSLRGSRVRLRHAPRDDVRSG